MVVKEFDMGCITVYTRENARYGGESPPDVTINWSAIGSVSIEKAMAFHNAMLEAIGYAVAEEKRIGVR